MKNWHWCRFRATGWRYRKSSRQDLKAGKVGTRHDPHARGRIVVGVTCFLTPFQWTFCPVAHSPSMDVQHVGQRIAIKAVRCLQRRPCPHPWASSSLRTSTNPESSPQRSGIQAVRRNGASPALGFFSGSRRWHKSSATKQ